MLSLVGVDTAVTWDSIGAVTSAEVNPFDVEKLKGMLTIVPFTIFWST